MPRIDKSGVVLDLELRLAELKREQEEYQEQVRKATEEARARLASLAQRRATLQAQLLAAWHDDAKLAARHAYAKIQKAILCCEASRREDGVNTLRDYIDRIQAILGKED